MFFNYVNWIEQNYPQGEKTLQSTLEKCILLYYKKGQKYKDNEKLLSIFLKCTNIRDNPLQMFQLFCREGFFKQSAQFYISFAYWYEANGNFKKALDAIQKGIHQRAQPLAELTSALADLEVRTVRHMVTNPTEDDKSSKPSRKALTGLKAKVDRHGVAEAPVKRIGSAVISNTGGLKATNNSDHKPATSNEQLMILTDENFVEAPPAPTVPRVPLATTSISGSSITSVEPLPAEKENKENERDPGKWNENKLNVKGLRKRLPPQQPASAFEILEDNSGEEVKTSKVESNSQQQPQPQPAFITADNFPVAKFEDDNQMRKYIWNSLRFQMYPADSKTEFAFEELRYQKWLEREQQKQEQQQTVLQETIQDEHSSKSMCDSSDVMTRGATSMVRDFFNGTLSNSDNESVAQMTLQQTIGGGETFQEIKDEQAQKSFAIFSETMASAERLVDHTFQPTQDCDIEGGRSALDELDKDRDVKNEMQGKEDFTMTTFKEDDLRTCSSSTPCASRTFKRPANMTVQMQSNPNFVSGITAKLSPIIETSREYNKSSSSSGSSTGSKSSTTCISGCFHFSETFHNKTNQPPVQEKEKEKDSVFKSREELIAVLNDPDEFYARFRENNDFISQIEAFLEKGLY